MNTSGKDDDSDMAFGISKQELQQWKEIVGRGGIALLTHYWFDPRFPQYTTVTKVGCSDLNLLTRWCKENGLDPRYIHNRQPYPHFDLIGPRQAELLQKYANDQHIPRFGLTEV